MTTVSVIIPSYNHEKYIEDCIESVLQQTFQDFEIIITDDGSTDNTVRKIKNFPDQRIKLFVHEKNKGASIAANYSYANASGKYIAMLSSDDLWVPDKLEKQVNFLETHEEINAVFSRVIWIDKFGNSLTQKECPYYYIFEAANRTRFQWLNYFFYKGNVLCHPSSLIRKNVLDDIGYLNPLLASLPDFDLWIRLCLNGNIYIINEKLIKFRYFEDMSNASGNTHVNRLRNRYEHRKILDNYLSIQSIHEFQKIFPQTQNKSVNIMPTDLKYLLGQLALETGIDYKILWGLDKIYNFLQDERNLLRAEKYFEFSAIDFINLTSQNDIHNIITHMTLSHDHTKPIFRKAVGKILKSGKFSLNYLINTLVNEIKLMRKIRLLNKSKYYNEVYYLNHNPDVRDSGINPAKHYLLFGGFEGRDPSPFFNSQWYLDHYHDINRNNINPLIHYLQFGINEGLKIKGVDTEE